MLKPWVESWLNKELADVELTRLLNVVLSKPEPLTVGVLTVVADVDVPDPEPVEGDEPAVEPEPVDGAEPVVEPAPDAGPEPVVEPAPVVGADPEVDPLDVVVGIVPVVKRV